MLFRSVAVMSAGRLLQIDEPSQLWAAPASREVAEFLGYQAFVPADGGWLAIGPQGLIATAAGDGRPSAGADADAGVYGAPGDGDGDGDGFAGAVVSSAFRRGSTEVLVDVDLGAGVQRCSATAPGAVAWPPGTPVRLAVAAAATAFVPAGP